MEWGSLSEFSRLALNTINFDKTPHRPFEEQFYFSTKFNCCTQFTRDNTLPLLRHFALEADNFSSYFDYFQDEE